MPNKGGKADENPPNGGYGAAGGSGRSTGCRRLSRPRSLLGDDDERALLRARRVEEPRPRLERDRHVVRALEASRGDDDRLLARLPDAEAACLRLVVDEERVAPGFQRRHLLAEPR